MFMICDVILSPRFECLKSITALIFKRQSFLNLTRSIDSILACNFIILLLFVNFLLLVRGIVENLEGCILRPHVVTTVSIRGRGTL